ncbi:MAG: flagellar biosynthesis protein FlhF [Spirochaetaceae bacterium]|jgi:flagellar biosynthesis protein FlhF|nr:flagellar biosynthesis protein FlhF [Spirochaetaceae bacterium]
MEYFTERGRTLDECMKKVTSLYGERADVKDHKKVVLNPGFLGFGRKEGVEVSGFLRTSSSVGLPRPQKTALSNVEPFDLETAKEQILAISGKGEAVRIRNIEDMLKEMRNKLDDLPSAKENTAFEHENLDKIDALLEENDFSEDYRKDILNRLKRECTIDDLEDYLSLQQKVIQWIADSISIYDEGAFAKKPRIMVLIGPTGVGKTTTIAKLAAIYGTDAAGRRPLQVRLINIDTYRIGAKQQIEKYGGIMEIPVSSVNDFNELKKEITLFGDSTDLILVDTIGRSPRKGAELGQMKDLLAACPNAEFHLVMMAGTKTRDINEILQNFDLFGYRSVLVTKMDESTRPGNMISALAERGKPVSFITNGQQVPKDIEKAGPIHFLQNLDGFTVDWTKIQINENQQIQWK